MIFSRRLLFRAIAGATAAAAAPAIGREAEASPPPADPVGPSVTQPVVEVSGGRLRGIEVAGVRIFKGVPYGASTAGPNRLMPPRPVLAWSGERDALVYGPMCPARPSTAMDTPYRESPEDAFLLYRNYTPHVAHEDCLRLNVWAPSGNGRRPVLVYMHGGGFAAGSGNDLLAYDGENLARRGDVVVVTHNHRLNLFGYLDLSGFGGRWSQSINVGMQDIVAMLRWVRDNVGAFGGDAGNVTIFGQSGGGAKVLTLMAMPSAKGLFHKAIVQSGAIPGFGLTPAREARELTSAVLEEIGVPEDDLDRLADAPTDRLCQAAMNHGRALRWSPVVDGTVVASTPGIDAAALSPGVPLLVGTVLNELANPVDDPRAATFDETALRAEAAKAYGATGDAIVSAYRSAHPGRAPIELWYAMQAAGIRSAAFELARRKHALDGKAWQYLFGWATPMLEGRPKTFHSAEIAFVFDNADLCVNQSGGGPGAMRLAAQMSGAWIAFARRGDPNHNSLANWPAFSRNQPTMIFDEPCRIELAVEEVGRRLIGGVA